MATLFCRSIGMCVLAALYFTLIAHPKTAAGETDRAESLISRPGLQTTEWLAANLDQPELRIIDARGSLSAYLKGHIPGAVYLNIESLRLATDGTPGKLLPPEDLARTFSRIGISSNSPVIVYSAAEDSFAASTYVARALEFLGDPRVAVLDGGFDKWQEESRPITKDFPKVSEEKFSLATRPGLLVTADQISKAAAGSSAIVVDARSPQEHAAGHIPGSVNLPLHDLITSSPAQTWKSVDEIRRRAAQAGITADTPVITYCNSGRTASQLAFTLSHLLGVKDVSVYDGSMADWTARDMPMETSQTTATAGR